MGAPLYHVSVPHHQDAVGIPEEHSLMGDETYNAALEVEEKIKNGEIVPPANADEYAQFGK